MMRIFKNSVRIFFVLLLLMLMVLSVSGTCFGSSVTYDGEAKDFVFLPGNQDSPADLFENFKSVMPGDVLTDSIVVRNDGSGDIKVKLYVRAVETAGDEEFLSKLRLKVEQGGGTLLANGPASDKMKLKDWVYLGTFYPGESATLDLALEVPIELDDSFRNAAASINWEFKAEELPAKEIESSPKKTGDVLKIGMWLTIGIAAMIMFIFTTVRRRSLL